MGKQRYDGCLEVARDGLPGHPSFIIRLPGSGETTPIPISGLATWQQDQVKFGMPPTLDGFKRELLVDYGDKRLDVAGTYQEPATGTTATLYLFKPPIPDVPMWHDRSLASIQPHSEIGAPNRASAVTAPFSPRGPGTPATGLRTVMPVTGGARSTGLAMFQLRDWLVAVRMTSQTLDEAQLAARLDSFVFALPFDAADMASAPVTAMGSCSEALSFKSAKRASPPDLGATLLLSALSGSAEENAKEAKDSEVAPARVTFCRDAASTGQFGVYRANGSTDDYVIAVGDDGMTITVARQPAVALLGGKGERDYWIDLSTIYATSTYRGFRSLPAPNKVITVVNSEAPLSSVERDGAGNTTVNLNSAVLK
jgi:hypothetical protein